MKSQYYLVLLVLVCTIKVDAKNIEAYILNGEESPEVRFYVYLEIFPEIYFNGTMIYFGGGNIISSRKILTVAQNVNGFQSWRAGVGANQISAMEWFNSTESYIHPEYSSATLSHNIALIILSTPIIANNNFGPIIRMPIIEFPNGNETLHIVGFGFGATNDLPQILKQAQLIALSQDDCSAAYPHLMRTEQLDAHFCAVNKTTNSNICGGDQGGPIYSRVLNMLIGIQSFNRAQNCDFAEAQPPAFLKVAPYNAWINSIQL